VHLKSVGELRPLQADLSGSGWGIAGQAMRVAAAAAAAAAAASERRCVQNLSGGRWLALADSDWVAGRCGDSGAVGR
jgi:hypothetical protein